MSTSSSASVRILAVVFGTAALAAGIGSCDLSGSPVSPGDVAAAAAGCPDLSSASAAAKVDFAKTFGIDVQTAGKIKAGVEAALELDRFAAKLDAKLKTACGNLARDLGSNVSPKDGAEACKAAATVMGEVKQKLGAGFKIKIAAEPPRCEASFDAMADCAAKCDATLEPGKVDVECERGKLAGTCEGQCSGSCDLKASAKCDGTCHGSCEAQFNGTCGGKCDGKCDGKAMKGGQCNGTCVGTCSADAHGSCGGKCEGSCELKGSAKCEGTCHGSCSVEMKAPRCEGEMTPPKASAECKAKCQASVQADVECKPPKLAVVVEGGADAQLMARYKAALEKNLPAILEVAVGMKDEAVAAAGNVKAVIEAVQVAIKGIDAGDVAARLTACVAAPFAAAFDAAASLQANVSVSVEVQASASASASGSASGRAG